MKSLRKLLEIINGRLSIRDCKRITDVNLWRQKETRLHYSLRSPAAFNVEPGFFWVSLAILSLKLIVFGWKSALHETRSATSELSFLCRCFVRLSTTFHSLSQKWGFQKSKWKHSYLWLKIIHATKFCIKRVDLMYVRVGLYH